MSFFSKTPAGWSRRDVLKTGATLERAWLRRRSSGGRHSPKAKH